MPLDSFIKRSASRAPLLYSRDAVDGDNAGPICINRGVEVGSVR